ncbi:MAG: zinc ribbon domain-containing protein [Verrucomicrobia bacterium]|nr:zinc ribbon domain-containing protein [Verrucomicrobiota bacterium]
MALINCPECAKQVSTSAQSCPSCGYPIAASQTPKAPPPNSDELLAEVRPSWWEFFWHLVFFWLIVPLIVAWWQRASVVLRIYPGRITLERGLFSKCYREFLAKDIRSLDIDQGVLARLVDIGDLTISTAATVDASEEIGGIPHPKQVRELIISQRHGQ